MAYSRKALSLGWPRHLSRVFGHEYGGFRMHLLRYFALALVAAALGPGFLRATGADDKPPDLLVGYTEFRTDLPGGRYVNQATFRAVVVKADGTGRRVLAEELTREKNTWTQFRGGARHNKALHSTGPAGRHDGFSSPPRSSAAESAGRTT
jgi:hypothetical protein